MTAFYKDHRYDGDVLLHQQNPFARRNVTAIVLEVPSELIGKGKIHAWATISLLGHAPDIDRAKEFYEKARVAARRRLRQRCRLPRHPIHAAGLELLDHIRQKRYCSSTRLRSGLERFISLTTSRPLRRDPALRSGGSLRTGFAGARRCCSRRAFARGPLRCGFDVAARAPAGCG